MNRFEQVESYAYLWDGSDPGWVLNHLYGHYIDLSLTFGPTGPSNRELMAVRRTVLAYKSLPVIQVSAQLRGSLSLSLGRFMSDQARMIASECRKVGLRVVEKVINAPRFVLTNEIAGTIMLIEDDLLANEIFAAAIHHGVPVRHTEL